MGKQTTDIPPHHIGTHKNNLAPEWSWAYERQQGYWGIVLSIGILGILLCLILISPSFMLHLFLYSFTTFITFMAVLRLLAIVITLRGARHKRQQNIADTVIPLSNWPRFTVLVPLYQEAHMAKNLIHHLSKIDYPADKLDIYIVTEADDIPTCQAVKRNLRKLSANLKFHIYEVSPSQPRTKPKALNATLAAIPPKKRGEFITIYDAEDRPHPKQLKQAALRFAADPKLAALQAPLGYYNDSDNFLTAQFGLEYAALFHVWNPALAKLGIPFTLGGTSNHIRREILELCGGWDSDNVTEDADLSFRIYALRNSERKLKIGTIEFPTDEEAVNIHADWVAQRSRWLKGFMQTWCVHMRTHKYAPDGTPLSLMTRIKITCALQITVGATLLSSYLHVPSLLIMFAIYGAESLGIVSLNWPHSLLSIMLVGYSAAILTGIFGAVRANKLHLIKHTLFMPFYWLLYFRPAVIASYEIVTSPTHWRKTTHIGTNKVKRLSVSSH